MHDVIGHILPNISRSKGNQTLKFVQNISSETVFPKNYTQNVVEKLFPHPFLKNEN